MSHGSCTALGRAFDITFVLSHVMFLLQIRKYLPDTVYVAKGAVSPVEGTVGTSERASKSSAAASADMTHLKTFLHLACLFCFME